MEEKSGLVIGLDIQDNTSQVCYYDDTNCNIKNIVFDGNRYYAENPFEIGLWTEKMKENGHEADKIIKFVSDLVLAVKKDTGKIKFDNICVTSSLYTSDFLDTIHLIMKKIEIRDNEWSTISHAEAGCFYSFSQKKEYCMNGVMILDNDGKQIKCSLLGRGTVKNKNIIMENYSIIKLLKPDELNSDESAERVITELKRIMNMHRVSCTYLTGSGFSHSLCSKKFTSYLCSFGKVFAGQNIYVRGAAYHAHELLFPTWTKDVIPACRNRITTGIEIDICERGKNKRLVIVRNGVNWYSASRSFEFFIWDEQKLIIHMKPADNRDDYEKEIDLGQFPYRKGMPVRVCADFRFESDSLCKYTIRDLGFGEIIKSSGKVINGEISIM